MSIYQWRRIHVWLSVVLSLQLVAWFGSGLLMSAFPIEQVRGNDIRRDWPSADWSTIALTPAQLPLQAPVQSVALQQQQQTPVYYVLDAGGDHWFNAQTGQPLSALTIDAAQRLALSQYQGTASVAKVQLLQQIPLEARGLTAPVYRVDFSDNSSFYLHAVTGQLLRVRTDLWRAYDIAWMLHIMDYRDRDNSHNPLVIVCSLTALLFCISGMVLLVPTLKRRRRQSLQP